MAHGGLGDMHVGDTSITQICISHHRPHLLPHHIYVRSDSIVLCYVYTFFFVRNKCLLVCYTHFLKTMILLNCQNYFSIQFIRITIID